MKLDAKKSMFFFSLVAAALLLPGALAADPGRYPQLAQHQLPPNVAPQFITLNQLVDEIVQRRRPLIVDVRSREEYEEAHIKGSLSLPLDEVARNAAAIPKDRLVVFY